MEVVDVGSEHSLTNAKSTSDFQSFKVFTATSVELLATIVFCAAAHKNPCLPYSLFFITLYLMLS